MDGGVCQRAGTIFTLVIPLIGVVNCQRMYRIDTVLIEASARASPHNVSFLVRAVIKFIQISRRVQEVKTFAVC